MKTAVNYYGRIDSKIGLLLLSRWRKLILDPQVARVGSSPSAPGPRPSIDLPVTWGVIFWALYFRDIAVFVCRALFCQLPYPNDQIVLRQSQCHGPTDARAWLVAG